MEGGFFIGGDFMKKLLRFLSCIFVMVLLSLIIVFSVSAQAVSYPTSGFSYYSGEIFSDSSYTNRLSLLKWQSNTSASEYAINLFSSSANIKSAILSVKSSSGNFFVLKPGEYVSFSICLRTYSNDSPNSYQASVECILAGDLPLQFELHEDKQEVIGLSKRTYFSGTLTLTGDETLYCDFLRFKYSQSIATRFVEFALRECSINVFSDASMIVDGIGDKIDSLPQYQNNFNGSYDVGGSALDGAEQNNMNAASDGLNGAKGFFNGMLSNISAYGNAFSVISLLMTKLFTNVPPLYAIVNFSVAIGLFGLLIGVLLGAVHRVQREDRIRADRASRASRRKGGSS